jgi:predicted alpha-1,2-mannosidase
MSSASKGSRLVALVVVATAACGGDDDGVIDGGVADGALDGTATDAGSLDAGPPPPARPAEAPLAQWVDPFIGTGGLGFGVGSTYPGPAAPFGMVHPGPDTSQETLAGGFAHCSGYWYEDDEIRGFSHTRMHGTGIPDWGAVALMPTIGMDAAKTGRAGYTAGFSHDTEVAEVGYYAVTLGGPAEGVRVELTATERVGLHRYTFPAGSDAVVLMDVGHVMADIDILDGHIEIDAAAGELSGFSTFEGGYSGRFGGMPVYFVVRFSRAFASHGVWKAGTLFEGELSRDGNDAGAWVAFDTSTDAEVVAAVGISFVDVANARMNLDAEAPALDFDAARVETEAAWEALLGRVEIEGRSERDFRIFYTALYHSLLMPTLATDVDGAYRGLDEEVHQADGFVYYTDLSLWDTFRTLHPLILLIYPEYQRAFVNTLMAMARDGGYLPRWPLGIGYTGGMVGDSAVIVIGESAVKELGGFDLREAYDLAMRTAGGPTPPGAPINRHGIADFIATGYIPIEAGGSSASWTLELAYADHVMASMAELLGETDEAAAFRERGQAYRNLHDPATDFLLGRYADGSFPEIDDPFVWEDFYAEGNAWQYNWYAPHDLEGLAETLGGRAAFLERLETFFESSVGSVYLPIAPDRYYWHGNEPDIHAPWIFAALDRPAETARYARWVAATRYGDGPDGLPGNDDGGTLSAWYVFTALGIFPIAGLDHYLVSAPMLTRATLHLEGGDVVIEAPDASDRAIYVEAATLDGAPLERARISHAELADGATLVFETSETPTDWARVP